MSDLQILESKKLGFGVIGHNPKSELSEYAEAYVLGNDTEQGSFGFITDEANKVVKGYFTGNTATAVDGIIRSNNFVSKDGNGLTIKYGVNVDLVKKGFIFVATTTATPAIGDKVFTSVTTGENRTGTGTAPGGFIDTGWVVKELGSQDVGSSNLILITKGVI